MQEEPQGKEEEFCTPENCCRIFRYYRQFNNPTVVVRLPLDRVPYRDYYGSHKKDFSKLSAILKKYKIDPDKFIRFCVLTRGESSASDLLSFYCFKAFAEDLKISEQYHKIYIHYIKSAEYVADECMRRNITPIDFLKDLVKTRKLAYEFMCGNLSMYYLASINGLEKICRFLDQNSIDELGIILDVREKLNQDVQDVFMKYKNRRVSPLALSEEIIERKQRKAKKNN